jgi:hypothetical protein
VVEQVATQRTRGTIRHIPLQQILALHKGKRQGAASHIILKIPKTVFFLRIKDQNSPSFSLSRPLPRMELCHNMKPYYTYVTHRATRAATTLPPVL